MLILAAAFVALASSPGESPTSGPVVALAMQPAVGFSDEEVPALTQRLTDEISGDGALVVQTESLDAGCISDPECVETTRSGLLQPPTALLVVEIVRVGPVAQLTANGAAGDLRVNASQSLEDQQLAGGPLLPAKVHGWLKEVVEKANAAKAAAHKPPPEEKPHEEKPSSGGGFELTPMKSGALFAGGVGIIALAAGIVAISTQEAVLSDPKSAGEQKESAHVLERIGVGVAVVGAAAIAGGVALWFLAE